MSATCPKQRVADILQTLDMLGPSDGLEIAFRSGYGHNETLDTLKDLAAKGQIERVGARGATMWRLP